DALATVGGDLEGWRKRHASESLSSAVSVSALPVSRLSRWGTFSTMATESNESADLLTSLLELM
ncbi:hypothetical protein KIPB_007073, partial [Kipferlia bialata]